MDLKQIHICLIILMTFHFCGFAQEKNFWKNVEATSVQTSMASSTTIREYESFQLDLSSFQKELLQAPYRHKKIKSSVTLSFPISNTEQEDFSIYKTNTLSPALAEKIPFINSYTGISKDKKKRLRLTATKKGIFAMISTTKGVVFINPYPTSKDIYQVFERKNATPSAVLWECLSDNSNSRNQQKALLTPADVNEGILRKYRLAVATTGEYAQFHIDQAGLTGNAPQQDQIDAVMIAIAVTIDRVNEVYERDLSITLELIDDNEDLIYLNANSDPFDNSNNDELIDQSQTVIDNIIGTNNYDIGHTFSTAAGGLAYYNVVCSNNKAKGVTGISNPVGDPFDIDFVAHEMGHQFGGNHTFNGNAGNCTGNNRNDLTAVEPGSGSTIMAYAGICPGENVQSNSDPYFHATSIEEIYSHLSSSSGSCAEEIITGNNAPIIISSSDYTIPYGTAFLLTAAATDIDGDELTYTWEQTDNEVIPQPPSATATEGPVFRSFPPTEEPSRSFPSYTQVLEDNLTPTWEVVPNVARQLNFAVTVRDNNFMGGQSLRDDVVVTVVNTGPFKITSQSTTGISYDLEENFEVTWDVAGTTGNNINTSNVNIFLSYDEGLTFSEVLALNTPNDGSQLVQAPLGTTSTKCRLMIKPVNNIYYAVNSENFTITDGMGITEEKTSSFVLYPNPNHGEFTIEFQQASGEFHQIEIYDLRGRLIHSQRTANLTETIRLHQPAAGIYLLKINNRPQQSVKKLVIE